MQTERGNLNAVRLPGRAAREPGICRDGKTDFRAAFHADDDLSVHMNGGNGGVSQGVHATSQVSAFYLLPQVFQPWTIRGA